MKISKPTVTRYINSDAVEALIKAHELMSSFHVEVKDYTVSDDLNYVLVRPYDVLGDRTYLINVTGPVATVEHVFDESLILQEVHAHFAVEAVEEILDKINAEPVRIDVFTRSFCVYAYVYQDGKPKVFIFSTNNKRVTLEKIWEGHNVEPEDEVEVRFSYD